MVKFIKAKSGLVRRDRYIKTDNSKLKNTDDMGEMPSMDVMKEAMQILKNTSVEELTKEQKQELLDKGISEEMLMGMKNMGNMPMPMGGGGTHIIESVMKILMCLGFMVIIWLARIFAKKFTS